MCDVAPKFGDIAGTEPARGVLWFVVRFECVVECILIIPLLLLLLVLLLLLLLLFKFKFIKYATASNLWLKLFTKLVHSIECGPVLYGKGLLGAVAIANALFNWEWCDVNDILLLLLLLGLLWLLCLLLWLLVLLLLIFILFGGPIARFDPCWRCCVSVGGECADTGEFSRRKIGRLLGWWTEPKSSEYGLLFCLLDLVAEWWDTRRKLIDLCRRLHLCTTATKTKNNTIHDIETMTTEYIISLSHLDWDISCQFNAVVTSYNNTKLTSTKWNV